MDTSEERTSSICEHLERHLLLDIQWSGYSRGWHKELSQDEERGGDGLSYKMVGKNWLVAWLVVLTLFLGWCTCVQRLPFTFISKSLTFTHGTLPMDPKPGGKLYLRKISDPSQRSNSSHAHTHTFCNSTQRSIKLDNPFKSATGKEPFPLQHFYCEILQATDKQLFPQAISPKLFPKRLSHKKQFPHHTFSKAKALRKAFVHHHPCALNVFWHTLDTCQALSICA